jgi:hypothetical protein
LTFEAFKDHVDDRDLTTHGEQDVENNGMDGNGKERGLTTHEDLATDRRKS